MVSMAGITQKPFLCHRQCLNAYVHGNDIWPVLNVYSGMKEQMPRCKSGAKWLSKSSFGDTKFKAESNLQCLLWCSVVVQMINSIFDVQY